MMSKFYFAKFIKWSSLFCLLFSFFFSYAIDSIEIQKIKESYHQGKTLIDKEKRIESLESCVEKIERLPKAQQGTPESKLLWLACKGEMAELKSKWVALSYLKPLREKAEELLESEPNYYYGAAHRILGRLYQRAPHFISYGDSEAASRYFLAALKTSPDFPGNMLFYADFLRGEGRLEEAKKFALKAIQSKDFDKFPLEKEAWLKMANSVLEHE